MKNHQKVQSSDEVRGVNLVLNVKMVRKMFETASYLFVHSQAQLLVFESKDASNEPLLSTQASAFLSSGIPATKDLD